MVNFKKLPVSAAMSIVLVLSLSGRRDGRLAAQAAPQPHFEAASVKVNRTRGRTTRRVDPDRLTYLNITLGEFVQLAFNVQHYQIEGPSWVTNYASEDRYDIVAKATMPSSQENLRAMLAPLLGERFHLSSHREPRLGPVYALMIDKNGPKFKEGDGGSSSIMPDPAGGFRYQNYPMAGLAAQLSLLPTTGRPVLDRTGLSGRYTFTANLQQIPPGTADQKEFVVRSESPVFSALREQLGLKLEPQQASIEMLVIDHADKIPTED